MNLSRRSLLTGLIAAPAVIAANRLMPIKLWLPTIYGDAIHDDYEGLSAWLKGERVNILPRGFSHNDDVFNIGEGVFRVSNTLEFSSRYSILGRGSGTTIKADPGVPYVIAVNYNDAPPASLLREYGRMTIQTRNGVSVWGEPKSGKLKNHFSEN